MTYEEPASIPGDHPHVRRHRRPGRLVAWLVVALWIGILVAVAPIGFKLSSVQKDGVTDYLPASAESTRAAAVTAALPGGRAHDFLVVYQRSTGITADDQAAANRHLAAVSAHYADAGAAVTSSPDRKALLLRLSVGDRYGDDVRLATDLRAVVADHPRGLDVKVTGPSAVGADLSKVFQSIDVKLLLATVAVVAVLLILTYRSPFLWIVPLLAVACAALLSMAMVFLLVKALGVTVSTQTASIFRVLVFGAGTDYALLLTARYREELRHNPEVPAAMARAIRGAVPAIVASAATVVAGLLCLLAADMNSLRGLGPVAATGVACTVVVMTTLFPALLVVLGRPVFWPAIPRPGGSSDRTARGWYRLGQGVARHWAVATIGAIVVLGVLAGGLHSRIGDLRDADKFTKRPESVTGYQLVTRRFPQYAARPLTVLARPPQRDQIIAAVRETPGVAHVLLGRTTADWVEISAFPVNQPDTQAERDTIVRVRDRVHAIAGTGVLVGGQGAENLDLTVTTDHDRNRVVPLILAVVLLVLVLLLRAIVAAVMLIVTVVLSFAAAMGASILVFTHLFGFKGLDPTVPVLGFMFLVALGVDYNIFLMTRAREETANAGARNGMVGALATTGGVITSAGLVLAATFAVLAMLPIVLMVEIGFLVAFGVLLDTFVVRSVLVPAVAFGLGRYVWWPGRLAGPGRAILTPPGPAPGPDPSSGAPEPAGLTGLTGWPGPTGPALDEERFRIARDLHHVIANSMSAINAHAAVAAHLLQANPRRDDLVLDKLAETMRRVNDAARAGMAELQTTEALLRGRDAPHNGVLPSLRNLDELTRPLRSAGATVKIEVTDDVRLVPMVLDITAYRLVEAALADASRNSGIRNVFIGISRDGGFLRITVADDGRAAHTGTAGMATRAGLVGGQLTAAHYHDGYRIDAALPFPAALPYPTDDLGR